MKDLDKYIGGRIKYERVIRGFKQEIIADLLNVTPQQIRKYEIGLSSISASKLKKICDFFGCETISMFPDKKNEFEGNLIRSSNCPKASKVKMELMKKFDDLGDTERKVVFGLINFMSKGKCNEKNN